jgi:hypothetical protein
MPILRRRVDGGFIIRGFVREAHGFCTWQLSDQGIAFLTKNGFKPNDRLPSKSFQHLLDQRYAFTGRSGIIEASITPDTLEDPSEAPRSAQEPANIDENDAKAFARWLPRLTDRADDVREQAAVQLGKLAVRSPVLRERLVPLLLDFTVEEPRWHVLFNGLYFYGDFGSVPKSDPKWIDAFVDVYLEVGATRDHKQFGAWRELSRLLTEGHLPTTWLRIPEVLKVAQESLAGATDESRANILAITDWIEDNC